LLRDIDVDPTAPKLNKLRSIELATARNITKGFTHDCDAFIEAPHVLLGTPNKELPSLRH
jgi:hypothetical protein